MTPCGSTTNLLYVVPMTRIERVTSPLPRECSTTEPHGPVEPGLNLKLSLLLTKPANKRARRALERVKGIEPSS